MARPGGIPLDVVACDLTVFTPNEGAHHAALLDTVRKAVLATEEMDRGYRFTLGAAALAAAAEWIAYERRCCPFFDFTLTWPADHPSPTLTLTGPAGAKPFLTAFAPNTHPPTRTHPRPSTEPPPARSRAGNQAAGS